MNTVLRPQKTLVLAAMLALLSVTAAACGQDGVQPDAAQSGAAAGSTQEPSDPPTSATATATETPTPTPTSSSPAHAETTPPPAPAPTTPPPAPATLEPAPTPTGPPSLRAGDSGPEVAALQQRLTELGYWLGTPDGNFGGLTKQAVYALQKAAGVGADGVVGPNTRAALEAGTRPSARSTGGHVVEVDREHQLLLLVNDGRVDHILNTSTGTFKHYTHEGRRLLADTPEGQWEVFRQVDGWRDGELGRLYRPKYFNNQGIAVHGYESVPPYPASHGCVRVTIAAMDWLWANDQLPKGTPVWVY